MEVLAAAPVCCTCGHPPCGQYKGSSLTLSRLELRLRRSAALLDSPYNKAAMRTLLLGRALSSNATYKPPPPSLFGFKKFQTSTILSLHESRSSEQCGAYLFAFSFPC
jgi:hypothetical protein